MNLWCLVYTLGNIKLYMTENGYSSKDKKDAIRFEKLEECKKYNESINTIITFSPEEIYFEENYLHK